MRSPASRSLRHNSNLLEVHCIANFHLRKLSFPAIGGCAYGSGSFSWFLALSIAWNAFGSHPKTPLSRRGAQAASRGKAVVAFFEQVCEWLPPAGPQGDAELWRAQFQVLLALFSFLSMLSIHPFHKESATPFNLPTVEPCRILNVSSDPRRE